MIKIIAIRRRCLRPKCTKFDFGWDPVPDTSGSTVQRRCKGFYS